MTTTSRYGHVQHRAAAGLYRMPSGATNRTYLPKSFLRATIRGLNDYSVATSTSKPTVTVGNPVARLPPYISVRALLTHTAPTSGIWREIAFLDKGEQYVPWEARARTA
jgi:hypothetical protein